MRECDLKSQLSGVVLWQCRIFYFLVVLVAIPFHIVMIPVIGAVVAFQNVWSMFSILFEARSGGA
jgi:hypothetical protein